MYILLFNLYDFKDFFMRIDDILGSENYMLCAYYHIYMYI